jgi:hypothetical protein
MRKNHSTRSLEENWIFSRAVAILEADNLAEWLSVLFQSERAYEIEMGMRPPHGLSEKILACAIDAMTEAGASPVLRWTGVDLSEADAWVNIQLDQLRTKATQRGWPLGQMFLFDRTIVERDANNLQARGCARFAVSSLWRKIKDEDSSFGSPEQLAVLKGLIQ